MPDRTVTVAIPVRDGAALLEQTLAAVREQLLDRAGPVELLICDSGSTDASVEIARRYGARVIEIAPEAFSHGGTRNVLMENAQGDHVAFLTQDSVPASRSWLANLLQGFNVADQVALTFGPYLARPGASVLVAREQERWFRLLSPDGRPRVDWLGADERDVTVEHLLGALGYFTDANGCVSKAAWRSVPFREVAYAEDHLLAHDMLRAGFAKVYVPDAAVIHSHDYSGLDWLRRSFDEARAMCDVYGFSQQGELRHAALTVWGSVGADWRCARERGGQEFTPGRSLALLTGSLAHRTLRAAGTVLGTHSTQLPGWLVRRLSLEGRFR